MERAYSGRAAASDMVAPKIRRMAPLSGCRKTICEVEMFGCGSRARGMAASSAAVGRRSRMAALVALGVGALSGPAWAQGGWVPGAALDPAAEARIDARTRHLIEAIRAKAGGLGGI